MTLEEFRRFKIQQEGAAMASGPVGSQALPPIDDAYRPTEGFFQSRYRMAQQALRDPNASWLDIGVNTVLGAGVLPLALLETPATALYNAPNSASRAGQYWARSDLTSDPAVATASRLSATVEATDAFLALAGPASLISVRPVAATPRVSGAVDEAVSNPLYDNPSQVVQDRVGTLRGSIPENSRGRITMAVGVAEDQAGARTVLIGTSEPRGYIRPGVTINEGEVIVRGTGHAEADIVRFVNDNDLLLIDIGATRPVCIGCASVVAPTGAKVSTPFKYPNQYRGPQ
jgi:hypothetical protein